MISGEGLANVLDDRKLFFCGTVPTEALLAFHIHNASEEANVHGINTPSYFLLEP